MCFCRITFTVVSDPDNDDTDCQELGNAEVDLKTVNFLYEISLHSFVCPGDVCTRGYAQVHYTSHSPALSVHNNLFASYKTTDLIDHT